MGDGEGAVAGGGVRAEAGGAGEVLIRTPLLGDQVRRGCAISALSAWADATAVQQAFTADADVTSLSLHGGGASAEAAAAEAGGDTGGEPTFNEAEEVAMRLGFAEQMEADFWGVADS
jgi:3-oxoacyl-ACP reductase-like protein